MPKVRIESDRSRIMRSVRSVDTRPELVVRRLVFGMGYRYRLHYARLPGKPDLTFVARRKVIFVNGCFWHGHACARGSRMPKTNSDYWRTKIARTRFRDRRHMRSLKAQGWRTLVIWECDLADLPRVTKVLTRFLR